MCIPRIWLRRVIEAEPFEVWGGKPRRDLLYVDDAAEAVLYAVVTREAGGLALNVGREEPCADLAEAIIMAHAGREIRDRNFRRSASASISATLYTTIADFAQSPAGRVRLADGLRRSLDYYRRHLACYL
jgi:UDP-glucose 4-epimerase